VHRAAPAQFGKLIDKPGESVLIGRLVANREVNFNASLCREAGQGASSSIDRYSLIVAGIRFQRFALSEAFPQSQPETRFDICSSFWKPIKLLSEVPVNIKAYLCFRRVPNPSKHLTFARASGESMRLLERLAAQGRQRWFRRWGGALRFARVGSRFQAGDSANNLGCA